MANKSLSTPPRPQQLSPSSSRRPRHQHINPSISRRPRLNRRSSITPRRNPKHRSPNRSVDNPIHEDDSPTVNDKLPRTVRKPDVSTRCAGRKRSLTQRSSNFDSSKRPKCYGNAEGRDAGVNHDDPPPYDPTVRRRNNTDLSGRTVESYSGDVEASQVAPARGDLSVVSDPGLSINDSDDSLDLSSTTIAANNSHNEEQTVELEPNMQALLIGIGSQAELEELELPLELRHLDFSAISSSSTNTSEPHILSDSSDTSGFGLFSTSTSSVVGLENQIQEETSPDANTGSENGLSRSRTERQSVPTVSESSSGSAMVSKTSTVKQSVQLDEPKLELGALCNMPPQDKLLVVAQHNKRTVDALNLRVEQQEQKIDDFKSLQKEYDDAIEANLSLRRDNVDLNKQLSQAKNLAQYSGRLMETLEQRLKDASWDRDEEKKQRKIYESLLADSMESEDRRSKSLATKEKEKEKIARDCRGLQENFNLVAPKVKGLLEEKEQWLADQQLYLANTQRLERANMKLLRENVDLRALLSSADYDS